MTRTKSINLIKLIMGRRYIALDAGTALNQRYVNQSDF